MTAIRIIDDHLELVSIGTNTHVQIDTHIVDSSIHFSEASISHLNITDIGTLSHATIDSYLDQAVKVASSPQFTNLGIGIAAESGKVKVLNKAVLFDGTTGGTPTSGRGARLMWIPVKKAFRAGYVSGAQWDNTNIGDYSVAFSSGNIASGWASTCFGYEGVASSLYASHFGYQGTASHFFTTCFGGSGIASGMASTHFGSTGIASGDYAIHFGKSGIAAGEYSIVGGKYMQLTSAAEKTFVYGYSNTPVSIATPNAFLIFPEGTLGNLGLGTKVFGTASNAVFGIGNGVAPTSSPANMVQLYAEDVGGSSELKVRDEAGHITTLSPHNFKLFSKPDEMAWSYHSKNPYSGKEINVDMWSAIKELEKLTGKQFIYTADIEKENKAEQEAEVEIQNLMQEKVEVTKDEAIEIATPINEESKKRYIFNPQTGETDIKEAIKKEQPEKQNYQIKKHYWLDSDTGKYYRQKTRKEMKK